MAHARSTYLSNAATNVCTVGYRCCADRTTRRRALPQAAARLSGSQPREVSTPIITVKADA
jgi:hypothetical protein